MGEHGLHVGWKFLRKFPWTRCPMGINRSRIIHYFHFVKHQFWVHSLVTTLFFFFLVIIIKFCWNLILHMSCSCFMIWNLKLSLPLFMSLGNLGCFCACDTMHLRAYKSLCNFADFPYHWLQCTRGLASPYVTLLISLPLVTTQS
jgi:hypothetical protein